MSIELFISFRGMKAPTVNVMGKQACGLTLHSLVEGREIASDTVLFAYREGIIWKAVVVDPEIGDYRIRLISEEFHYFTDITISREAIAQGTARITIDRERCRRKLTPVFVQRLFVKAAALAGTLSQLSLFDGLVLAEYRRRFRAGPVGVWLSSHDMLTVYGTSIEFRNDGTGEIHHWGSDDDLEEYHSTRDFEWESKRGFAIEIQPTDGVIEENEWGLVEFDLKVARSPYGNRVVVLYSKNGTFGEDSFWQSPCPVELVH